MISTPGRIWLATGTPWFIGELALPGNVAGLLVLEVDDDPPQALNIIIAINIIHCLITFSPLIGR
jgi:hypothetical protein